MTPARGVLLALAVLLLTGVFAAFAGDAMTWDGAALFFTAIDGQHVTMPHARFSVALFQLPAIVLSYATSNVRMLEVVYGLSYTLIPALSAILSWCVLLPPRRHLVVWQLAWIGAGAIAGQLFFVTECLIALHLSWPLIFLSGAPLTPRRLLLGAALAIVLFGLHPVSTMLLGFASVTAAAAHRRTGQNFHAIAAVTLFVGAAGRALVSRTDTYELSQLEVSSSAVAKNYASLNLPPTAVIALALAVLCLAAAEFIRPAGRVALAALLVAGIALIPWARSDTAWRDALNYRFLAPLAYLAFGLGAASTRTGGRDIDGTDAALSVAFASLFAVVIGFQSATWLSLRRVVESVVARPHHCMPMWGVPECSDTALKWWPTPAYSLVVQGRAPQSIILDGNGCKRPDFDGAIQLNPWQLRPRDRGWFDLTHTGLTPPK